MSAINDTYATHSLNVAFAAIGFMACIMLTVVCATIIAIAFPSVVGIIALVMASIFALVTVLNAVSFIVSLSKMIVYYRDRLKIQPLSNIEMIEHSASTAGNYRPSMVAPLASSSTDSDLGKCHEEIENSYLRNEK